ncbi:MAG: YccF domain-containing protein [Bacteroidales bacterium]|nr:YccF domain-containing protein [Bacteroidales bacterium]MBN2817493.1 YccF domain-containing protein [Bacteroidales bacterium]
MRLIANILWIILGGGIILFFEYLIGGMLLCITIIGIPFGLQKLKLAVFVLAPFGQKVADNYAASGCLAVLFNVLWILLGGFWIAITHLVFALIYAITIIGLPFAKQHIKLASLAIAPFGRTMVTK